MLQLPALHKLSRANALSGFSLVEMIVVTGIMSIALLGTVSIMKNVATSQTKVSSSSIRNQLITRFSALLNNQNALLITAGQSDQSPAGPTGSADPWNAAAVPHAALFGCIANTVAECPYSPAARASTYQPQTQLVCVPPNSPSTCALTADNNQCSACGSITQQNSCNGWIYGGSASSGASPSPSPSFGPTSYLTSNEKTYCVWSSNKCVVLTTNALTYSKWSSNCPSQWIAFTLYDSSNQLVPQYYTATGTNGTASSYAFKFTPYFKGSSAKDNYAISLYFTLEADPASRALGVATYTSPTTTLSTPLSPVSITVQNMCDLVGGTMTGSTCFTAQIICTNSAGTWDSTAKTCISPAQISCTTSGGTWDSTAKTCISAQVSCTASGGTWDSSTKTCISAAQISCTTSGGTWNSSTKTCVSVSQKCKDEGGDWLYRMWDSTQKEFCVKPKPEIFKPAQSCSFTETATVYNENYLVSKTSPFLWQCQGASGWKAIGQYYYDRCTSTAGALPIPLAGVNATFPLTPNGVGGCYYATHSSCSIVSPNTFPSGTGARVLIGTKYYKACCVSGWTCP